MQHHGEHVPGWNVFSFHLHAGAIMEGNPMRQSSRRLRVSLAAALLSILMAASSGGAGPETGKSGARPALDCPPCDDGNACTSDTCDPSTGTCGHAPIVCDDANLCTTDTCDPAIGCVFDPLSAGTPCDDGKACTQDSCSNGFCQHFVLDPPCDDGNACTIGDRFGCGPNGQMVCFGGATRICDPGDHCFSASCDPASGCVFTYRCDDHNPCTYDSCNVVCNHLPLSRPCDDGDPCTIDSRGHAAGDCRHVSRSDDGNVSTDDRCDPASPHGCPHAFNTASCHGHN